MHGIKAFHEELAEKNYRYMRPGLETTPWNTLETGVIQRVNEAELKLLGYSREEYVGHRLEEFHADPAMAEDILRRLQNGETLRNHEATLRAKDGSLRQVMINCNVLWDDDTFMHSRCVTRDITGCTIG